MNKLINALQYISCLSLGLKGAERLYPLTTQNAIHAVSVLQSIKYITEKLKGNCQFTSSDGMFALRVIL